MESLIAILILFVGFFLVTRIIRNARHREEIYRKVRQNFGFYPALTLDNELTERIRNLVKNKDERINFSRIYSRDCGAYRLFSCCIMTGSNSNSNQHNFILVRKGLNLPSFRMAPGFPVTGKWTGFLQKMARLALKSGDFEPVVLDKMPEFNKKYFLAARNPNILEKTFPEQMWRDLGNLPFMVFLKAEGEIIVFSIFNPSKGRTAENFENSEMTLLKQALELAGRLNKIFQVNTQAVMVEN
ncbi:MAG: hypothetical protein PHU88_12745 [candidate division Zixibacteria bacterium]|nr:hypothetical protein [candidate division Zixibacteria bacterium]MDD5426241.1 hypothetical protein [candidate division Zixibacteria bacterium]